MMEQVGISGITEDYLTQPSCTVLGCIIETKGASSTEPQSVSLKMAEVDREFDECTMSNISMQCMGISETGHYAEQLLPDHLLSFAMSKPQSEEKEEVGKTEDNLDQTSKNMYEGLLDKCNGDDSLLNSSNQDWGYIESFISESKMELLDLCSKNELSVNLFSEDDVDNYMFDDDDEDSTHSSDMCSLKIRYESFQDNMREKTNVLHEETQFNFFPSVLVNETRVENTIKAEDSIIDKPDELQELESDAKHSRGFLERPSSPKVNYFIDSANLVDDSEDFGVDSSSSRSSFDSFHENSHKNTFSRKTVPASSPLNYGLREKRKVRYSDDYLYDVDSIENEKNQEKREPVLSGPREEQDDDWRPKKRRKSSRKESPMIIKYIIINKFKGEKHTCVKLGKIDPEITTVSLNKDAISDYEKLTPLKDFWQHKQEDHLRSDDEEKPNIHHDDCHRLLSSSMTNKSLKPENEAHVQGIQISEKSDHELEPSLSDLGQDAGSKEDSTVDPESRLHEIEQQQIKNKIIKLQKFESKSRVISRNIDTIETVSESVMKQIDSAENKDVMADTEINSDTQSPQSHEASEGNKKYAYMPTPCPSNEDTPSEMDPGMPVIPGGYLQTLLDASDSLSSSSSSLLSQQTSREPSMTLTLEGQDFAHLQIAQSCVLSPPSESELQQSPHSCPNLTQMWHSQLDPNQQFATNIPGNFSNTLPIPVSENVVVPEYNELSLGGNRALYEQAIPTEAEFHQLPNQLPFQRNNTRLISFNLVDSLSATTTNYGTLGLKTCSKDGEENDNLNETFMSHCSPKLVTQPSLEALTPLRESTDLLDISNFTPDKFRHTLLSAELSPPETPDLSPQLAGRETKMEGKVPGVQNGSEVAPGAGSNREWYRGVMEHPNTYQMTDNQQYQMHKFTSEQLEIGMNESDISSDAKVSRSKRKNGNKQGQNQKKSKASKPKVSKGDKVKIPRQNSRASKKLKALLDEKNGKAQIEDSTQLNISSDDCPGMGFTENNGQSDYQQEFEEPSNILSNIVSGMAEVQRFMKASIDPTWGPTSTIFLPADSNSLSLKTLKILAGTVCDSKKKGSMATRGTKSRKGSGGKNQAKFNPVFPQLSLSCNVFEKSGLGVPGVNGPAHKKMYRHKTSSKFPRVENLKGKQADKQTDIALMASFEKLR